MAGGIARNFLQDLELVIPGRRAAANPESRWLRRVLTHAFLERRHQTYIRAGA